MTGVQQYSTAAGSNASVGGISVAEGMAPAGVNDAMRQIMADVATFVHDAGWVNYSTGTGGGASADPSYTWVSGTQFKVLGSNVTTNYRPGRRVRAVGVSTGTIYGTITASSFSTDTTVTVAWDSGSMSNETLAISLAAAASTGLPLAGGTGRPPPTAITATTYAVTANDHDTLVRLDTSSNAITVNLPAANTVSASALRLRYRHTAGSNTVTITAAGTDKIVWPSNDTAGYTSIHLPTIGDTVVLESDLASPGKWLVVSETVRGPFCRVTRANTQTVNAGATSTINYDTVTQDTHTNTSGSGNTFTPEVPGVYAVTASVGMAIASGRTLGIYIAKGGTPVSQKLISGGATGTHVIQAHIEIEMNGTTDAITASVFNGDASNQNTDIAAYNTFMTVARVR